MIGGAPPTAIYARDFGDEKIRYRRRAAGEHEIEGNARRNARRQLQSARDARDVDQAKTKLTQDEA